MKPKRKMIPPLKQRIEDALLTMFASLVLVLTILFLPALVTICVGTFVHIASWLIITCISIVSVELIFVILLFFVQFGIIN